MIAGEAINKSAAASLYFALIHSTRLLPRRRHAWVLLLCDGCRELIISETHPTYKQLGAANTTSVDRFDVSEDVWIRIGGRSG